MRSGIIYSVVSCSFGFFLFFGGGILLAANTVENNYPWRNTDISDSLHSPHTGPSLKRTVGEFCAI